MGLLSEMRKILGQRTLCPRNSSQENNWAVYSKEKTPEGSACARCHKVMRRGFPRMSWDDVIMKCKVNPEFLKCVRQMLKLQVSGKDKTFPEQHVLAETVRGYRAYKELIFLNEKQFSERYGVSPKEAQVSVESLVLHNGETSRGVLLDEDKVVKVQVYGDYHSFMSEVVMNSGSQLRANQGTEEFSWHTSEVAKQRPKQMSNPWTEESLAEHIQKQKAKRAADLEHQRALAELAPAQPEAETMQMELEQSEPLVQGPLVKLDGNISESEEEGMAEASVPGAVVAPKRRAAPKPKQPRRSKARRTSQGPGEQA